MKRLVEQGKVALVLGFEIVEGYALEIGEDYVAG